MITHILTAAFTLVVLTTVAALLWHSLGDYGRPS